MKLITPLLLAAIALSGAEQAPTPAPGSSSAPVPAQAPMTTPALPLAFAKADTPGFVAIREYLLVDLVDCTLDGTVRPYAEIAASAPKIKNLPPDSGAVGVRVEPGRWAIVVSQTVYVRTHAITVVDARSGATPAYAPTPAVPGGAGVLPLPQSIGTTVSAGTSRIFAGVRTAQVTGFRAEDLRVIASLVQAPTAETILAAIAAP